MRWRLGDKWFKTRSRIAYYGSRILPAMFNAVLLVCFTFQYKLRGGRWKKAYCKILKLQRFPPYPTKGLNMASSSSSSSAPHHTRSNSLPSRQNVTVSQLDEQISRLRSSKSASSSSSLIKSKLTHLTDLYECVDEFLQLPSSQRALSSQASKSQVENELEGSIKLLDVCSIISDVFSQMKESAQELQSSLRRRCSDEEISKAVAKYMRSKKAAMKVVSKALKNLKKTESDDSTNMISRLSEIQMVTLTVLESVLVAIAGSNAKSGWESVISKLKKSRRTNEQETDLLFVGFETMDAALCPEKIKSRLEKMEMSMKDVEQGVESLFRHLIKTRTTILNVLNC